ncbi:hypothetical protein RZS08_35985, partial [Arthrospira platensis SPKY1]|nr:hypothetical protein [Arthrospira platensis SPKY1]
MDARAPVALMHRPPRSARRRPVRLEHRLDAAPRQQRVHPLPAEAGRRVRATQGDRAPVHRQPAPLRQPDHPHGRVERHVLRQPLPPRLPAEPGRMGIGEVRVDLA